MSFGLSIENANNKLVLSTDALLPCYLGRATHVSTQQPTQVGGGPGPPLEQYGFSTYTITHVGDTLIPFIRFQGNRSVQLLSMSKSGSTWTLRVYCGDTPVSSEGFETQYVAEVYCWGVPQTVSGFGLALYNPAQQLVADLTRRPLIIKQKIDLSSITNSVSLAAGITTPAIAGRLHDRRRNVSGGPVFWTVGLDMGAWRLNSGTTISRNLVRAMHLTNETTQGTAVTTQRAVKAFVVDVAGLV